jgi:hypothetical protein
MALSLKFGIILGVIGVAGLGLLRTVLYVRRLSREKDFLLEFGRHLKLFVESNGKEYAAYGWLTMHALKMQSAMGPLGVFQHYRGPGFTATNYQIVLNLVPEIRDDFVNGMYALVPQQTAAKVNTVQDALMRYAGMLDELATDGMKELKNPLIWLREGVQALLIAPFALLRSLGLLPDRAQARIARSPLFRILSGTIVLVGLLGSIITIAIGWKQFHAILQRL